MADTSNARLFQREDLERQASEMGLIFSITDTSKEAPFRENKDQVLLDATFNVQTSLRADKDAVIAKVTLGDSTTVARTTWSRAFVEASATWDKITRREQLGARQAIETTRNQEIAERMSKLVDDTGVAAVTGLTYNASPSTAQGKTLGAPIGGTGASGLSISQQGAVRSDTMDNRNAFLDSLMEVPTRALNYYARTTQTYFNRPIVGGDPGPVTLFAPIEVIDAFVTAYNRGNNSVLDSAGRNQGDLYRSVRGNALWRGTANNWVELVGCTQLKPPSDATGTYDGYLLPRNGTMYSAFLIDPEGFQEGELELQPYVEYRIEHGVYGFHIHKPREIIKFSVNAVA